MSDQAEPRAVLQPGPVQDSGVQVCLCTFPDSVCAVVIARTLVEEQLVACVNLLPGVMSIYRWEGAVEQAEEVQAILKTTSERLPALMERLRALHPYDCPELLVLDAVAGLPAYLEWVHTACACTGRGD